MGYCRKKPKHFEDFAHPGDESYDEKEARREMKKVKNQRLSDSDDDEPPRSSRSSRRRRQASESEESSEDEEVQNLVKEARSFLRSKKLARR